MMGSGLVAIVFLVGLYLLTLPLGGSHDHPDGSAHIFVWRPYLGHSTCACGARLHPMAEAIDVVDVAAASRPLEDR